MATVVNKCCEWCKKDFQVSAGDKKRILCSRECMYAWRKNKNWEVVNCVGCNKEFLRRKNEKHHRTGLPPQYCSNSCSLSSHQKKDKLRKWANSESNHWNRPEVQQKVKSTKLLKYGDENYNNATPRCDGLEDFRFYIHKSRHRVLRRAQFREFNITLQDLKEQWERQDGRCAYSGIPLVHARPQQKNDKLRTASLDRINSSVGYVKGNVQFIMVALNYAKNDMTHEQMLEFCEIMRSGE